METPTDHLYGFQYMASSRRATFGLSIMLGLVLVVLGIGAYVLTDFASVTALIPAIFGGLIALLGEVGRQGYRERLAAYGIGLLALLGILGSTRGIPDLIALLMGESVESVIATLSQGTMIVICLVLLVAVAKFILESR